MNNPEPGNSFPMRLARFIALAGLASRRDAETIIAEGRAAINGITADTPGIKVNNGDTVTVDGVTLLLGQRHYIMLNKPRGYHCTAEDPHADKLAIDLVDIPGARLFSAGRLDRDSEGLLILTNDGDYAAKLTHPRHNVTKLYMVETLATIPPETLERLRRGIVDDGETLSPLEILRISDTCYRFMLNEGKKREIRRMIRYAGTQVVSLRRTAVGCLELGGLPSGQWRALSPEDIEASLKPSLDIPPHRNYHRETTSREKRKCSKRSSQQ